MYDPESNKLNKRPGYDKIRAYYRIVMSYLFANPDDVGINTLFSYLADYEAAKEDIEEEPNDEEFTGLEEREARFVESLIEKGYRGQKGDVELMKPLLEQKRK